MRAKMAMILALVLGSAAGAFPAGYYSALVQLDAEGRVLAVDYQVRIEKYAGRGSAWRKVIVPGDLSIIIGDRLPAGAE